MFVSSFQLCNVKCNPATFPLLFKQTIKRCIYNSKRKKKVTRICTTVSAQLSHLVKKKRKMGYRSGKADYNEVGSWSKSPFLLFICWHPEWDGNTRGKSKERSSVIGIWPPSGRYVYKWAFEASQWAELARNGCKGTCGLWYRVRK